MIYASKTCSLKNVLFISLEAQNYFTFADVAIEQKLYSKAIFKENSYSFRRHVSISGFLKNLFTVPVAAKKKIIFLFVGSILYFLKFLLIYFPNKKINPVSNSKTYKVQFVIICKLIFTAHALK